MKITNRNIYREARNFAHLTIETAAEQIGVASRTLAGYEKNEYTPPGDIVAIMCDVYRTEWLAYQHMQASPLGRKYLPEIDFSSLPATVLRFQREMAEAGKMNDQMVEVACDGRVDRQEQEAWATVTREVRELIAAGMAVLFAGKEQKERTA